MVCHSSTICANIFKMWTPTSSKISFSRFNSEWIYSDNAVFEHPVYFIGANTNFRIHLTLFLDIAFTMCRLGLSHLVCESSTCIKVNPQWSITHEIGRINLRVSFTFLFLEMFVKLFNLLDFAALCHLTEINRDFK